MQKQHREEGQAIIVFAVLLVVVIGMLGIAVDGGNAFLNQRSAQNAADAAMMAAVGELCRNGDSSAVEARGYQLAVANGFVDGQDGTTVQVNHPPASGPAANDNEYVEVVITREVEPFFIQLVYNDTISVGVRSAAQCSVTGNTNPYAGNVLFATSSTCNNTLRVSGSNQYYGGSIHSNNDVQINSSNAHITGEVTHAGNARAQQNGGCPNGGSCWPHTQIDGDPDNNGTQSSVIPLPLLYNIADYAPGGARAQEAMAAGRYYVLSGGHYPWSSAWRGPAVPYDGTSGSINQPGVELPREGLIYVQGDLSASGGGMYVSSTNGVTVVAEGQIQFSGNQIRLLGPYMDGLQLFSMAGYDTNNPDPTTAGSCNGHAAIQWPSSNTTFRGIVYAPGGHVNVPTSSTSSTYGAIISYTIGVNVANIDLRYDASLFPSDPPISTIRIAE